MGLQLGDTIPEFSLQDQHGKIFEIGSVLGKTPLVIYFYPKDNTPGCTKEACAFRDSYQDFTDLGAEVIGISSDTVKSHQNFASKHDLPFVLLADSENKVRKLFGIEDDLFGLLPGRETYVIDRTGTIIMVFNSMNAKLHTHKALLALGRKRERQ